MMVLRRLKYSSVDWGVIKGDIGGWAGAFPEVHNHLYCLSNVELQFVLTATGHQMVNLTCGQNHLHQSSEGGVIHKLQAHSAGKAFL